MRTRLLAALILAAALLPAATEHVVLVSIDGFAAYHLQNAALELPNIRALIRGGAWAGSSETIFPSVTHPSHTTIVTGVEPRLHGVLANTMVNRVTGESFRPTNKNRSEVVLVPTLFDAAKAKGLTTAAFFWPETKGDPAIDVNIPEVFNEQGNAANTVTAAFRKELLAAGINIDLYFDWYGAPRKLAGDLILTEAAAYTIRKYKPGLLAIHLVSTDSTQHTYGPHHYLSEAALTNADAAVGMLRDAVREAGLLDTTTFIITADHGFHSVYEEVNIRPVFAKAGLLDKVKLHPDGWTVAVEVTDSSAEPALREVFAELLRCCSVQQIAGPAGMHALGLPTYDENPHVAGHYLLIADIDTRLAVDPRSDSTDRRRRNPYHGHGYLPWHPSMYPSLVFSGAGIRHSVQTGHTRQIDIAPTVARLLGLAMPKMSGRVLTEFLEP